MRFYIMRFFVFCFLFISTNCLAAHAQHDSATTKRNNDDYYIKARIIDAVMRDSMAKINREEFIADSVAKAFIFPDSLREDQFITNLLKYNLSGFSFKLIHYPGRRKVLESGTVRKQRDPWLIGAIIGLIIYTALLNFFFGNDIKSIFQSFYKKSARLQTDKDGSQISWWAVIGLFILFSLTFGLFLYQFTLYKNLPFGVSGFQLFISLSVIISLLFALKYVVLKFLGFVFDIGKLVSQYIAVLNLTYFTIGFVLLFASICLSLLARQFLPFLFEFTLVIIAVIFAWQYIVNSVGIISNFRFHKFYLFIYLCALEICPILILIKALDI